MEEEFEDFGSFEDFGAFGDFERYSPDYDDEDDYFPERGESPDVYEEEEYQRISPVFDEEDEEEEEEEERLSSSPYVEEFFTDPSDYQRISGLGGRYTGDKFRVRSQREITLDRMNGILGDHIYSGFSDHIKSQAVELVEKIPEKRVVLLSIDILTPTSLYMVQYKNEINKSNIHKFIEKTSGLKIINHLDFVRYLRILEHIF